jgi:hypothetical protein
MKRLSILVFAALFVFAGALGFAYATSMEWRQDQHLFEDDGPFFGLSFQQEWNRPPLVSYHWSRDHRLSTTFRERLEDFQWHGFDFIRWNDWADEGGARGRHHGADNTPAPVPEPPTFVLTSLALLAAALYFLPSRRKRQRA